MRKVIYLYYLISYDAEEFLDENTHKYYSDDESEFIKNSKGEPIWILRITDNSTKDFRISEKN